MMMKRYKSEWIESPLLLYITQHICWLHENEREKSHNKKSDSIRYSATQINRNNWTRTHIFHCKCTPRLLSASPYFGNSFPNFEPLSLPIAIPPRQRGNEWREELRSEIFPLFQMVIEKGIHISCSTVDVWRERWCFLLFAHPTCKAEGERWRALPFPLTSFILFPFYHVL